MFHFFHDIDLDYSQTEPSFHLKLVMGSGTRNTGGNPTLTRHSKPEKTQEIQNLGKITKRYPLNQQKIPIFFLSKLDYSIYLHIFTFLAFNF